MKVDSAVEKEHDEIVTVLNKKGEKAVYKINSVTKQVFVQTHPGDGNDQEWRHTNVSYESIANHAGKQVAPVGVSGVQSDKPVEAVGIPGFEHVEKE